MPSGTLVHMKDGLTKIEDVKKGNLVLTSNGYKAVSDWVEQGIQEVLEIHHQAGVFKCTPKHKMAVMTAPNKYEWKQARELKPDS